MKYTLIIISFLALTSSLVAQEVYINEIFLGCPDDECKRNKRNWVEVYNKSLKKYRGPLYLTNDLNSLKKWPVDKEINYKRRKHRVIGINQKARFQKGQVQMDLNPNDSLYVVIEVNGQLTITDRIYIDAIPSGNYSYGRVNRYAADKGVLDKTPKAKNIEKDMGRPKRLVGINISPIGLSSVAMTNANGQINESRFSGSTGLYWSQFYANTVIVRFGGRFYSTGYNATFNSGVQFNPDNTKKRVFTNRGFERSYRGTLDFKAGLPITERIRTFAGINFSLFVRGTTTTILDREIEDLSTGEVIKDSDVSEFDYRAGTSYPLGFTLDFEYSLSKRTKVTASTEYLPDLTNLSIEGENTRIDRFFLFLGCNYHFHIGKKLIQKWYIYEKKK